MGVVLFLNLIYLPLRKKKSCFPAVLDKIFKGTLKNQALFTKNIPSKPEAVFSLLAVERLKVVGRHKKLVISNCHTAPELYLPESAQRQCSSLK